MSKTQEIMNKVAETVIAQMNSAGTNWLKPFSGNTGLVPVNQDNKPYRGINTLLLWHHDFSTNIWGTYKNWQAKGLQVGKREDVGGSTQIVFWSKAENKKAKSENDPKEYWFLKTYNVFNLDQCLDCPEKEALKKSIEGEKPDLDSESFEFDDVFSDISNRIGVPVKHTDKGQAFYVPSQDRIEMPAPEWFKDTEFGTAAQHYYSTLAHEFIHSTGHKSRLDRIKANARFGNPEYAFEELVAEMGAAFTCALVGVSPAPREDHARYLNNWMRAIKDNPKAIFDATKFAQKATDLMLAH